MRLRASGPAGIFTLPRAERKKYLFISAGSGITPSLAMTTYLYDRGTDIDVTFVHCAQRPQDIIARQRLEQMASRVPSIRLVFIVEQDDPYRVWTGLRGRLNQLMIGLIAGDYLEREVYCCGPEPFMDAVREMLIALGFDMARYHQESFGAPVRKEDQLPQHDALMADSIARLASGNSILYFTWTPYWVSGELVPGEHVEWLSVPYTSLPDGVEADTEIDGLNLGFAVDSMYILARDEFLAENPAAARLFEMARLDVNDISAQNLLMSKGEDSSTDIDRHVDAWIEEHRSDYDSWLDAARAAVAN